MTDLKIKFLLCYNMEVFIWCGRLKFLCADFSSWGMNRFLASMRGLPHPPPVGKTLSINTYNTPLMSY